MELFSPKDAKAIASYIFSIYDKDNDGMINNSEAITLLEEVYSGQQHKIDFNKHATNFRRNLDFDHDGKLTIKDIEASILRIMGNSGKHEESEFAHNFKFSGETFSLENSLIEYAEKANRGNIPNQGNQIHDRQLKPNNFEQFERELKRARNIFGKHDPRSCGFLQRDSFAHFIKEVFDQFGGGAQTMSDSDLEEYYNALDLDKDGKISRSEFEFFILRHLENVSSAQD